jgi:hypothetical protein
MSLKPKVQTNSTSYPQHRSSQINQQIATAVRPQLPRDGSRDGLNTSLKGVTPVGFTGVWNFADNSNTKDSSTSKPGGKKIY